MKRVVGGFLVQDRDLREVDVAACRVVSRRAPSADELAALEFAWRICKHVKSNAIVLANGDQVIGVGAGQMSRVDSARLAVLRRRGRELATAGTVAASDAFFPFRDGLDVIAAAGVRAVIQPGGSMRDPEVDRRSRRARPRDDPHRAGATSATDRCASWSSGWRAGACVLWKLQQSPRRPVLYCAPGNAGTATIARNVDIPVDRVEALRDFARAESIDVTVVGPELPLVLGIVDVFAEAGLRVFGPTRAAAQLEGSKAFTKDVLRARRRADRRVGVVRRRGRPRSGTSTRPGARSS